MLPSKILIIATSQAKMGESPRRTGIWLEELAVPYYIFRDAGAVITLASPKGGEIPLDPKSESIIVSTSTTRRFQKDVEARSWLSKSVSLNNLKAEDFDMVFLPGGHGPMWDFPGNKALKDLLEDFYRQHKLIGAVCHGVAGLVDLEDRLGNPLVKGKQLTAFSNTEETVSGLTDIVPFLLETKLISLGALYNRRPDFESYTVTDGNIITGQNPASAKEVAMKLLACQKDLSKRAEPVVY
ncbi:type 1 glutamine amidotransferase domain-containing protein [Flavitalea flava]